MQRDNAKLHHSERELKQRLYDEKKMIGGVLSARQQCVSKPLGRVQQSAQHRSQQSHAADVLQKRAAAKAEEATAAEVAALTDIVVDKTQAMVISRKIFPFDASGLRFGGEEVEISGFRV